MVEGYNIALKVDGKTILGRTQEDLSISATVKESITKDDNGVKKKKVTGHDVSFSVNALLEVDDSSATTKLDRDAVIALALKVGDDAEFPVIYSCAGGDTYTGTGIISSYSESSSAEQDADSSVSLNIDITGAFTKQS